MHTHTCAPQMHTCMYTTSEGRGREGELLLESIGKCLYDSEKVLLNKQVQEESAQMSNLCFLGLLNHTATVSPASNTHSQWGPKAPKQHTEIGTRHICAHLCLYSPTDILRKHCNENPAASFTSWCLLQHHQQSRGPAPLSSAASKSVNPTSHPGTWKLVTS